MKQILFMLSLVIYLSQPSYAFKSASPGGVDGTLPLTPSLPPPPDPISCSRVLIDEFTDANLNSNPTWSGETNRYEYVQTSEGGSSVSNARIMKVKPNDNGSFYVSTPINNWQTNQEWIFWYGRIQSATSASSRMRFWLYSNNSNLESSSASGYAVEIGDGSGAQEIRLLRVTNGVATTVIQSPVGIANTISDYGLGIRVVRNHLGEWELFTSSFPTANGGGIASNANLFTTTNISRGSATDATFTPNGNGFIGPVVVTSNSNPTSEFDQIYLTPCNPQTIVQLEATNLVVSEGGSSVNLPISIYSTNPSAATTATLSITSGDGSVISITPSNISFSGSNDLIETFESTTTPNNWTYSTGVTNQNSNPRTGLRALRFTGNNQSAITPVISNPGRISFFYRSSGTVTSGQLVVQTSSSSSGPWTNVATFNTTPTSYTNYTGDFTGSSNIFVRILHTRSGGSGSVHIDDFNISRANLISTIIAINDNNCTGMLKNLVVSLTNVSGGFLATTGTNTTCQVTVLEDDFVSEPILTRNFENQITADWSFSDPNSFTASSTEPITGSYSLRQSVLSPTTGSTSASLNFNGMLLDNANTTWRFNVRYFNQEPTPTEYFIVCLTNDAQNIADSPISGYAVGIRPGDFDSNGSPEFIELWKTDDDALIPLVTSTIDWGTTLDKVGFEITRSSNGIWTLRVDTNGDFDNLTTIGTATDTQFNHLDYFGPFVVYDPSSNGKFSIDDISISQESCEELIYSQASGQSNSSIWAKVPVGTPSSITPNPFSRLVLQSGHEVTFTGSTACRGLTIQPSASFLGGTASVSLRSNIVNNGTINGASGTIRFVGSAAQTISGTGLTNIFNLELENASGGELLSPASMHGQLRALNGTFNTNNQLTLLSTATGTGSIGTIQGGGDVIGQITLQRYIPPAPQNWVYISNPLLNQTISNWNDEIVTSGFPGSDFPSYNFNNIYHYDESQPGDRNTGWVGATNVTNSLDPLKGYIVFMNGNANTIIASGQFQKGTTNIPLSYNDLIPGVGFNDPDGWNLISNVYPSAIDWVAVKNESSSWNSSNGTYYVYDAVGSNYRAYNANILGGTANRFIASSQSFFVQATAPGQSISFVESSKSSSSAAFQRNTEDASLIRFELAHGAMHDEMLLTIQEGATLGFDELFDAIKWNSPVNTAPEMAFVSSENSLLTIQAIGELSESIEIPVYIEMPQTGTYTLSITEAQNLPLGVCLTVEDVVTGQIVALDQGQSITINNTAAYTGNRFIIRMTPAIEVATQEVSCFDSTDGQIIFNSPTSAWTLTAQNVFGNIFSANEGVINNLSAGDYLVMLENIEAICPAQLIGITISSPSQVQSDVVFEIDRCNENNNGLVELSVVNSEFFEYIITNSNGDIVASSIVEGNYAFTDELAHGIYSVNIITPCYNEVYNLDLNDPFALSVEVLVDAPDLVLPAGQTAAITAQAVSDNALAYEWTVNGFDGGDQETLDFTVNVAGTYLVECIASNEHCQATATSQAIVTDEVIEEEEEEEEVLSTDEVNSLTGASVVRMGNSIVITFHDPSQSKAKIAIYGASGKLVMQVNGFVSAQKVRTIDITGMASGMYVVHVEQDQRILAKQQIVK
jgi:hypothetical protein